MCLTIKQKTYIIIVLVVSIKHKTYIIIVLVASSSTLNIRHTLLLC